MEFVTWRFCPVRVRNRTKSSFFKNFFKILSIGDQFFLKLSKVVILTKKKIFGAARPLLKLRKSLTVIFYSFWRFLAPSPQVGDRPVVAASRGGGVTREKVATGCGF